MKIARLDNLERQDSLFQGGEPDNRYQKRQIVLVDNDYDFTANTATNITSVQNLYGYGRLFNDYLHQRDSIKEEIANVGWTGCTNAEKDIVIDYYLDDLSIPLSANSQNKVVHLMTTKGLSQADSVKYLQDAFGIHHIKDLQTCTTRANTPKLYSVVAKYLELNDARDFFQTVRNLYIDYKEQAIKGIADGDVGVGLFDYIESTTGSIYETAGMASKGYVMQNGDLDETNFIIELMDIFRNGNIN